MLGIESNIFKDRLSSKSNVAGHAVLHLAYRCICFCHNFSPVSDVHRQVLKFAAWQSVAISKGMLWNLKATIETILEVF